MPSGLSSPNADKEGEKDGPIPYVLVYVTGCVNALNSVSKKNVCPVDVLGSQPKKIIITRNWSQIK